MKKLFACVRKKNTYVVFIFKVIFVFACLSLYSHKATAQHPVTSKTIIKTPYSAALSDYYTGTDPRLTLYLTNTDLRQPVIRARLRLNITSNRVNLRSRDFVGPIIELDAGIPQILSSTDLAIYFNPSNIDVLSGLDYNALFKSPRLPDGTYTFRFDVVEAFTGQVLNNVQDIQSPINILSVDPPFLNLPRKGDNMRYTDPLNIIFNWTPRAANKGVTEYTFSLYEILDNGMPPENAPFMSQPIYQTTTQTTTLLYGPTEPPLLPGKRYAWRIRAVAKQGIDSYSIYNNDGYTETFWFQLQDNCDPVKIITATVKGGVVTLEWPENPNMYEYVVEYRKKGDWNRWFNTTTKNSKVIITDVAAGNTYEYRVGGACTVGAGATYSDIRAFTIPPRDSVRDKQCGILPNINLSNQKILESLSAGETVMVGDYPATILSVKADGSGMFSGTAAIKMDVFRIAEASVKTTFNSVVFNTDKQLIKGFFVTTYDSTEKQIVDVDKVFEGGDGIGKVKTGLDSTDLSFNFPINKPEDIKVTVNPDGTDVINVTGANGQTKQITVQSLPTTIKDSEGNIYNVDKDGKVTKVGKAGEFKNLNTAQLNNIATDKAIVTFKPHSKQQYAFDEWKDIYNKSQLYKEQYEVLSNTYHVSSKAIEAAKTDVVKAVIDIKDRANIIADSVKFVTGKGTRFESKYLGNNEYEITVIGGPSKDAQELYATYPTTTNNYLSFGKLLISSYPHKKQKLVLVPVNGASINKQEISKQLNDIYNKIAVEFDVQQDANFTDNSWDINGDKALQVDGSGLFSTLTDEMKALNNAYRTKRTIDKSTIYLFVLPKANRQGVVGDMPRAKQFGYLFNGSDGKTAAHEVGHGLFHLKHSFDSQYGFAKAELGNNVMDYPNGDQFAKLQWDAIHDPGLVIGMFESDGDGQLKAGIYFNPAGYPVILPENKGLIPVEDIINQTKLNGVVYGWESSEGRYNAKITNGKFYGYYVYDTIKNRLTNIPYQNYGKFNTGETIDIKIVEYRYNCTNDIIDAKYKVEGSLPTASDYQSGKPVVSSINYFNPGKKENRGINNCDTYGNDIKQLAENSLGRKFFDIHSEPFISDSVKTEMLKVAKLVEKMGKDIYNSFVVLADEVYNPDNYAINYPIRYPKPITTVQKAKELYEALKSHYDNCLAISSKKFSNGDALKEFYNDAFCVGGFVKKAYTNVPFLRLSTTRRIELLELLANNHTMRGRWGVGECAGHEDIILFILETAPPEQIKVILDELQRKKLLYKFVDGMNGGDFNRFITILTSWVLKVYPAPKDNIAETEKLFEEKRYVLFNNNFLGRRNTERIYSDGIIHVYVKKWFSSSKEYEINCDPYQYIAVTFKNDFSVDDNIGFVKGETYKLPAIFVYMLFNEDTKNKWFKSGKIGIDVALLALGVGEIKAVIQSAKWIRIGLAVTDMGIGFGDIIINTAFENEIKQNYPGFYSAWQKISFYYGMGRLTQMGIEATVKKCYNESKLIQVDATLTQETKNTAKQIQSKIEAEEELYKVAKSSEIVSSVDELAEFVTKNGIRSDINVGYVIQITGGRRDLCESILLSTKEVVEGKTVQQLMQHFNIPNTPAINSLSNYQTRIWYHWEKSNIINILDKSKTLEQQAKQAFDLRNLYRTQARQYMSDQNLATFLEDNEKNWIWEDFVAYKRNKENLSGDALWKHIIEDAKKGRDKVDQLFKIDYGN